MKAATREPSSSALPRRDPNALIIGVALAAAVCLALTAPGLWEHASARPGSFIAFLVLTLGLQLVTVEVYGRGAISFAGTGILAVGFTFGIGAAMWTGALMGVVNLVARRGRLNRGVFDASQWALAAGVGAGFYHVVGGNTLPTAAGIGAAIGAGGLYMIVNVGLLCTAMGLAEGSSLSSIWTERFRWFTPYYLVSAPLAFALTVAYERVGVLGLLAFALPPAMMMISANQYLSRTQKSVEDVRQANEELRLANDDLRELFAFAGGISTRAHDKEALGKYAEETLSRLTGERAHVVLEPRESAFPLISAGAQVGSVSFGDEQVSGSKRSEQLREAILPQLATAIESAELIDLLRESEERFRTIFESSAMGIRLADLDGRLLAANRSFEQMLGYGAGELAGTSFSDISHPDDVEGHLTLFRELVEGKRDSYQIEKRFLRRDGTVLWSHLTASLVLDADGRPQFAIGMVQDVTARKQLEEQLREAQKMDALGRLAGGIAHDFNNLLTVIGTYSTFALRQLEDDDDDLRRDIEEIQKAGERATSLTQQLLALSRRQVLQPQVLDLNAVVADTYKMLRRLIGENIEIVTDLGAALGPVKADPGQIEQVLINLVLNARDAMGSGGRLTIETANVDLDVPLVHNGVETRSGPYVVLTVGDTGCGMDEATRLRVFEPFFTTKEKGKGTGLGLSTVYGIVTQSGGTIFVNSSVGTGTKIEVFLPRPADATLDPREFPPRAAVSAGAETVLLVEDEDGVRVAARRILRERGYRVLEAFDGIDALRVTESHPGPIHLLITDVVMPRMGGPELVERLGELRPDIKVLYISGYTDEADVARGVAADDAGFLQKPFTQDVLAMKVRSLLDTLSVGQG